MMMMTSNLKVPKNYELREGYGDRVVRADGVVGAFVYSSTERSWRFMTDDDIDIARDGAQLSQTVFGPRVTTMLLEGSALVDDVPPVKRRCEVCGYVVNPMGHAERCGQSQRVGGGEPSGWSARRRIAWVADSLIALDVRVGLLVTGCPVGELGSRFEELTSGSAMSNYYAGLDDTSWLVAPAGTSIHSIATAFECNYANSSFRRAYLAHVFGEEAAGRVMSQVAMPDLVLVAVGDGNK